MPRTKLIVQGPGYYGVNIRSLTEEEAVAVEAKLRELSRTDPDNERIHENTLGDGEIMYAMPDGTTVILTQANGFDTGWWDQGEAVIDQLLSPAYFTGGDDTTKA